VVAAARSALAAADRAAGLEAGSGRAALRRSEALERLGEAGQGIDALVVTNEAITDRDRH
jgi:hypothetical protein